jgi:uncharacterized MnhB-related membrane protein
MSKTKPSNKIFQEILIELFYPKGFANKMGRFMAALSILALMSNSFYLGLSITIKMIISYYDEFIRVFFSWAEPYMHHIVNYFSNLINIKLTLNESWHHVFVVMWILFMRDLSVAFSDGRIRLSIIRGICGLCIAIIFSILASIEIGITDNLIRNAELAIMPYVGIYVYDLIMYAYSAFNSQPRIKIKHSKTKSPSKWQHFKANAVRAHFRFGLIAGAICLCLFIPYFSQMPFPKGGLIILAIATLLNLTYWVVRGIIYAKKIKKPTEKNNLGNWYSRFLESEAGRFSIAVASVFTWVLTFIVINTGAKILGL